MSVLIRTVNISPDEVNVGESITIHVYAEEATWSTLKSDFKTWEDVKQSFSNWDKVKDFIRKL